MDISRKLGILIFTAVPAIMGGGIVYAASGGSWPAIAVYEIVLLLTSLGFISK